MPSHKRINDEVFLTRVVFRRFYVTPGIETEKRVFRHPENLVPSEIDGNPVSEGLDRSGCRMELTMVDCL